MLSVLPRESGRAGLRGRQTSLRPYEPDPGHAGAGTGGRMIRRALLLTALLAAGCSLGGGDSQPAGVTLVTHDSFTVRPELLDEFQKTSGIKVEIRKTGDAGALTNQLVLTKANPIGDIAYGVDNTFASRALQENVFQPYQSPDADKGPQRYEPDNTHR